MNKNNVVNQSYKLFVDLDGVVADFAGGMTRLLGERYSDSNYETDASYRSKMWTAVADHQRNGGEMWYELELLEGYNLWDYIKVHNPEILSATGDPKHDAIDQKHRWVAEKFGADVVVNLVRRAQDKAQFAKENHILIDDKQKAIGPWVQAGGIGVLHTSAASTIQKLKNLGL